MAFQIIEDEAPITNTTVDLTPYKDVVQRSYKDGKTLGIVETDKKAASVAQNRFRSAADALGYGLRTELVELPNGSWKVRLLAKDKRKYTLTEEAKRARTAKALATRKANAAAKKGAAAPAPKGSRPAKRNA